MNRRKFIKTSSVMLTGTLLWPVGSLPRNQKLKFGWVTDIHYAMTKPKWNRFYAESLVKLKEAVSLYNSSNLDFIIETGDFKDQDAIPTHNRTMQYLTDVEREFGKYKRARYHVLGNHDMDSLSKKDFLDNVLNTGIPKDKSYYSFNNSGFKCIVLDACYKSDGSDYKRGDFDWTDTIIPESQLDWLKKELFEGDTPVLIFVHQLLDGVGDQYVNNSTQVRAILEESKKVMAVFQGHYHEGDYNKINNIHYITQKALIEGSGEKNSSYSIVTVKSSGKIRINGYKRMEDLIVR